MRPAFLLFALLLFCFSANAQFLTEQKNHYSFHSGLNIYRDIGEPDDSPNIEINIQGERFWNNRIGFAIAINYTYNNNSYNGVYYDPFTDLALPNPINFKASVDMHSIDIPLKFNWYFYTNDTKGIYCNLSAGSIFYFLISRSSYYHYEDGSTNTYKLGFNDMNINAGAYLGFDFTKVFLQVEQKSYFFKVGLYGQEVLHKYYNHRQFGLNVGVGMAL